MVCKIDVSFVMLSDCENCELELMMLVVVAVVDEDEDNGGEQDDGDRDGSKSKCVLISLLLLFVSCEQSVHSFSVVLWMLRFRLGRCFLNHA